MSSCPINLDERKGSKWKFNKQFSMIYFKTFLHDLQMLPTTNWLMALANNLLKNSSLTNSFIKSTSELVLLKIKDSQHWSNRYNFHETLKNEPQKVPRILGNYIRNYQNYKFPKITLLLTKPWYQQIWDFFTTSSFLVRVLMFLF